MIGHVVMWRLKAEAAGASGDENARKLKEQLERLPPLIPEIQKLEIGINFKDSEAACDVVLYTLFNSVEDLEAYQVHPEHKTVVAFVQDIAAERYVVDYEL